MTLQLIHALDLLLWFLTAVSTAYVVFFAIVSLCSRRKRHLTDEPVNAASRFAIIYPAYNEDSVIRHSVTTFLQQDYPADHFLLAVVSDHMQPETNQWLGQQPIMLLQPVFEKSSKAKALQYAIDHIEQDRQGQPPFDRIVILDADNVVAPDFLSQLNALCHKGHHVIQCHRTAKNSDNDIAALDGASEEINNTLFRRAHNAVGLSSALIGSGMCFEYKWFRDHVGQLSTAGEDRELEAMLLREHIHVHYADDIRVLDEKVSSGDNFQRQRLRWMTAQIQCLLSMMPYLPKAMATGNVDYIDKVVQQALIPRSMLLVLTTAMAVIISVLSLLSTLFSPHAALKWWALLLALCVSLYAAIPRQLRTASLFRKAMLVPQLVWRMLRNIVHIDTKSKDFIHTTHDK